MKSARERWQRLSWEVRWLIVFGTVAALPLFIALWPETPSAKSTPDRGFDTQIPKGFVLVPIDVQNYASLDSVFGRFGIVDLFTASESGAAQRPVARNVRLLRAPYNPAHFAVLVPESKSEEILAHGGSYVVTVKNGHASGTEFVEATPRGKRKIIYGGLR